MLYYESIATKCGLFGARNTHSPSTSKKNAINNTDSPNISARGHLTLPAKLRRRYGLRPGAPVAIDECDGYIRIRSKDEPLIDIYSDADRARLLLSNTIDQSDYESAKTIVRRWGMDTEALHHDRTGSTGPDMMARRNAKGSKGYSRTNPSTEPDTTAPIYAPMPDRLFLDANILFAAAYRADSAVNLLWEPESAVSAYLAKAEHVLISTAFAVEEAHRNLESPSQRARLDRLLEKVEIVDGLRYRAEKRLSGAGPVGGPEMRWPYFALAPKDQPILQAAVDTESDFLLTGDVQHWGFIRGAKVESVLITSLSGYFASLERE